MSADLFRQIEELLPKCDGWCELSKANALAAIVLALRPTTVVEVGVYGGRSAFAMAAALRANGAGLLMAIDPWNAQASIAGMADPRNVEWWSQLDHERIYQRYCHNRDAAGLGQYINTVRSKSDDVDPPKDISVFHCDGNHEETAYRDITRFGANVRAGGVVICDDLGWSSGAPQRGAEWLEKNGFMRLYPLGTGAVFQRVR